MEGLQSVARQSSHPFGPFPIGHYGFQCASYRNHINLFLKYEENVSVYNGIYAILIQKTFKKRIQSCVTQMYRASH